VTAVERLVAEFPEEPELQKDLGRTRAARPGSALDRLRTAAAYPGSTRRLVGAETVEEPSLEGAHADFIEHMRNRGGSGGEELRKPSPGQV
jgi:hypothetical protein